MISCLGLDAIALQVWSPSITVAPPHLDQHHGVFRDMNYTNREKGDNDIRKKQAAT